VNQAAQAVSSDDRLSGTVKFFNDEKGFGFIVGPDNKDYFVHYSNINMRGRKTLCDGQPVTFLPVKTDKGVAAHFVTTES
jgi:CspA family cold shock protein